MIRPSDIGGFGSSFGSGGGFITETPTYTPQPVTTQPAAPPVAAQPIAPPSAPIDVTPMLLETPFFSIPEIPYNPPQPIYTPPVPTPTPVPETPSFFFPTEPVTTQPVAIQPFVPEPAPPTDIGGFIIPEIPFFSPAPEPTPIPGGDVGIPVIQPAPPTDIGGYIIPDEPMFRLPESVVGVGSDYPFTDGVPTATPTSDNGFHIQPVDRIPLDTGGYGTIPITYPDEIHYLPMPDPVPADTLPGSDSPTPRGITPPDVPSDIGGFIPDIPNLPVTLPVSSQPAGDTTPPTDSTGDTTGTTGVINRLADLMAAQFAGGGGGSGGGLSALPVGIAPTQAQSSGSILPLLLIGGLILGGIWYFRKKAAS